MVTRLNQYRVSDVAWVLRLDINNVDRVLTII